MEDMDKTVVFDLRYSCSYPRYSDGGGNTEPLWLVAQIWETERGELLLDCDGCTALQLPANGGQPIRTFSMKDVLGGKSVPVEVLNLFARKIAAAAEGYQPVVILPDSVDDFTLADFRRALNLACPAVEYLPHSVASVYAWLLQGGRLDKRAEFAVRSVQGKSVFESIVRVKEIDHALKKMFPETQGVLWELVPSWEIGEAADVGDSLQCFERDEVDELARHGVEFVFDFGSETSSPAGGKVRFPPSSDKSEARPLAANHCFTGVESSCIVRDIYQGALLWNACRRKFPDKVLWSVCLPPLSTHLFSSESACWVDYFFVEENAGSIIPKRGLECSVPKKSSKFKLARGQARFAFPLRLGSRDTMYEAVLSLPQILNNDLSGSFEVKYTFGDSQPYCMRFIPDSTGADSIPCAIRVADLRDDSKHVPPPFRKKSWEEFCSGIEVHEAQCTMCDAEKGYAYLKDDTGESYYCKREAVYDCKWPLEPGQKYLFTKTNHYRSKFIWGDGGPVEQVSQQEDPAGYVAVINGAEYLCSPKANPSRFSDNPETYAFVLYVEERGQRRVVCMNSSQKDIAEYLESKCLEAVYTGANTCKIYDGYTCFCDDGSGMKIGQACHVSKYRLNRVVKYLSSSRDALYISDLYYLRRNIHDIDKLGEKCHALLRQRVDQITETPPENVASLAAWLFPVMNVNEQNAYADIILKAIPKHMDSWTENVVMAIGDAASDVQKKMLRRICGGLSDGRVDRDAYHVLARLMMRCDSLREWLSCEEVEMMLKNSVSFIKWQKENAVQRLDSTPFNALFCLLRYRESPDPEMRRLVASSAPSIQEMVLLVEQLQELLARQPIILHSSVHIPDSVKVPAGAHPLLYVLHHYLNSESGEMNITLQEED